MGNARIVKQERLKKPDHWRANRKVWLGSDPKKRTVVVKADTTSLQHEYTVHTLLDSPYFAKVYDFDDTPTNSTLVTEYFPGESLKDHIDLGENWESKKLNVDKAIDIVLHVSHAFQHLHEKGILYRDLNLDHIILTKNGLSIIDLEACVIKSDKGVYLLPDKVGTWETMPPEEFNSIGSVLTPAANVYSLGILLAQLVSGKSILKVQNTLKDQLKWNREGQALVHQTIVPEISSGDTQVDEVILKCLEKQPEDRYQSMHSLQAALKDR